MPGVDGLAQPWILPDAIGARVRAVVRRAPAITRGVSTTLFCRMCDHVCDHRLSEIEAAVIRMDAEIIGIGRERWSSSRQRGKFRKRLGKTRRIVGIRVCECVAA